MSDDEENTEEDEICLHASLSLSKAYVIDSGASNHMVAVGDIYHHTHSSWSNWPS